MNQATEIAPATVSREPPGYAPYSIVHRNVNGAWYHAAQLVQWHGVPRSSRAGPVHALPAPLVTTYRRPTERVLLHPERRANPFFHLFEAFWMLGGRRDAAFLNRYVKDFRERFAEQDGSLWGAYGWRWSYYFGVDQLERAVDDLVRDPDSRRVVISMWDPDWDPKIARGEVSVSGKDIPCNTHLYLRLRPRPNGERDLAMTVCCRSNDLVWGLYGSNAVHFSVLQEYLAWCLDARVGELVTLSHDAHVYEATAGRLPKPHEEAIDPYARQSVAAEPLFGGEEPAAFKERLKSWLNNPTTGCGVDMPFDHLLVPMARCHHAWKVERLMGKARTWADQVRPTDWRAAAHLWLDQRREAI